MAAEAQAKMGMASTPVVPKMLELLATVRPINGPRWMHQRYLSFALFESEEGGLLSQSLKEVDREAL